MSKTEQVTEVLFDIYDEYATDETLEKEGTWVPHGVAQFKIARTGNVNYANVISAKVEENRLLLDKGGEAADALNKKILIDTLAETILLDWKKVSYQGQFIEYSVENAKKLLAHRDFRLQVLRWADDIHLFKAKKIEQVVGN